MKLTLTVYQTKITGSFERRKSYDWSSIRRDYPTAPPEGAALEKYAKWDPKFDVPPIWYALTLTNVGAAPIAVLPEILRTPEDFATALEESIDARFGLYIEVFGPDGKRLPRREYFADLECGTSGGEGASEQRGDHAADQEVLRLRKAGRTTDEINAILNRRAAEARENAKAARRSRTRRQLAPGESISTKPWAFSGYCGDQPARSVGQYSELWQFQMAQSGHYQVRAVYDYGRVAGSPRAEEVIVRTAPIEVEVVKP